MEQIEHLIWSPRVQTHLSPLSPWIRSSQNGRSLDDAIWTVQPHHEMESLLEDGLEVEFEGDGPYCVNVTKCRLASLTA